MKGNDELLSPYRQRRLNLPPYGCKCESLYTQERVQLSQGPRRGFTTSEAQVLRHTGNTTGKRGEGLVRRNTMSRISCYYGRQTSPHTNTGSPYDTTRGYHETGRTHQTCGPVHLHLQYPCTSSQASVYLPVTLMLSWLLGCFVKLLLNWLSFSYN